MLTVLLVYFAITVILSYYLKSVTKNALYELYDNYGKIETDYVEDTYWKDYYCRCDETIIKANNYTEKYMMELHPAKANLFGLGGFVVVGEQSYYVYNDSGEIVDELSVKNQPLYFEWHLRNFRWNLHYI